MTRMKMFLFIQKYAVLLTSLLLIVVLSTLSENFLTIKNLMNILNQNAPLAIIASAMTMVIIAGGFDLSVGAIFAVCSVSTAWLALNVNPMFGLLAAPFVGLLFGTINGLVITTLKVHSFLATIATGLIFSGLAVVVSDGRLIAVRGADFTWLGRNSVASIPLSVLVLACFFAITTLLLNGTVFGRRVFSVGGNEEAAILSGIRTNRIRVMTFAFVGLATGLAAAIATSRISMGQATAGAGLELQAIAAVILGGTSVYGGSGAIWRSVVGVMLLALINNGFNILNADPFYRDLTTGLVILAAIGISSAGSKS